VKVKTNTVVKYVCPNGSITSDKNNCSSATTTVTTTGSSGGGSCPTTLPCVCEAGKPKITTTSTIKLGPPCDVDSDCGQLHYGDTRCSSGNVYNVKITPNCDDGHCKDLYEYEFKEECPSGQTCVVGEGCVKQTESN